MKKYEIWIGYYSLGQGSDFPTKPEKLAEVFATSFKIACVIFEHENSVRSLRRQMEQPGSYIEDIHFGKWNYDPKTNSNSWVGRYFETETEAWESFKKR